MLPHRAEFLTQQLSHRYLGMVVLLLACFAPNTALCQHRILTEPPCSRIKSLFGNPLSRLPMQTQSALKKAIRPGFETIVHDRAMGMEGAAIDTAELNVLTLTKPSATQTLYVVAWDDHSFGVNGFNWMVEVTRHDARNLTPPLAPDLKGFASGGLA